MMKENFVSFLGASMRDNWSLPAFSDYKSTTITYGEVATRIKRLHAIFEASDIHRGDRIALLGRNSSNWAVTYLAAVSYGAVIVPILPDFHPSDFEKIIDHSGAVMLFAAANQFYKLDLKHLPGLKTAFDLSGFELLLGSDSTREAIGSAILSFDAGTGIEADSFSLDAVPNKALAAIVYTSGTTGFSKGVMLTHNSFISNLVYSQKNVFLFPGDRIFSFLPLAHMFGCAFEFVFPFSRGCHITFLGKIPATSVLIEAFTTIRPRLVLTVPLVIEKIYYKQIRPMIEKPGMKRLLRIPVVNELLYRKIGKKLLGFFGGNVIQVIIGGASFNADVENFLKRVRFPYTIGYGMTECGPLITYVGWKDHKKGSVGHMVDGMELKLFPVAGSEHEELAIRGENLFKGYFDNPELTTASIDEDGWFHTGDLGSVDESGNIFIRGRSKTMILNSSGQNIYPEEIEARLNILPYVSESLVFEKAGRLSALIYPDWAEAKNAGVPEADIAALIEQHRTTINANLPEYSRVAEIAVRPQEFEKTPTNKIKRFLYTTDN